MTTIEDRLRAAAQAAAETIPADSAPPLRLDGMTSPMAQYLLARSRSAVRLMTYPVGACRRTAAALSCDQPATSPGFAESARIDGRAPGVQGRPAYWITGRAFLSGPGQEAARHFLAFQYAAGGWALLDYPARADALRIARTARFGLRAHIRFGAQLQQAPAPWRVTSVGYRRYRSRLTATELLISGAGDQSLRGYPQIFLVPAAQDPDQGCQPVGQHHRTQVINGYRVIVDDGQVVDEATGTPSPDQTVCASTADGLLVRVQVTGDQRPLTAVQVFGRLKLLGPDPAHWTTQPLR